MYSMLYRAFVLPKQFLSLGYAGWFAIFLSTRVRFMEEHGEIDNGVLEHQWHSTSKGINEQKRKGEKGQNTSQKVKGLGYEGLMGVRDKRGCCTD